MPVTDVLKRKSGVIVGDDVRAVSIHDKISVETTRFV